MGTYNLTEDAEDGLYQIWLRGVRDHGEVQADKYYFAFFDRFEKIAEQPYLYQAVDHKDTGIAYVVLILLLSY